MFLFYTGEVWPVAPGGGHLAGAILEIGGRDHFDDLTGFFARVPKDVPSTARFEDTLSWSGFHDIFPKMHAQSALQHGLVCFPAVMKTQGRRKGTEREEKVDNSNAHGSGGAVNLPLDAKAAEVEGLGRLWRNDCRGCIHVSFCAGR